MSASSPLAAVHEQLGATFTQFAGWTMPVRYGSDRDEHHAVRERVGLFDLSHMGELGIRGRQAAAMLDYAMVGHLSALEPGRARYTMMCVSDGGVLDDLIVYRLGDDRFVVVANAGNTGTVRDALNERSSSFEVEVEDVSASTALIGLQGPAAAGALAFVTTASVDELKFYAAIEVDVAGSRALLARTGYTGEDGFELYCAAADAETVWHALLAAGRDAGITPCGLAARDTLRLEAGMPLYGHELTRRLTPYEAGLGRIVKLDKPGDFVGRDALRARAETGPTRRLVGLVSDGRRAPRAGYRVDNAQGEPVGTVTSGALSPTLGHPIALAYVDPLSVARDQSLQVDVRGTPLAARVVEPPFYRRNR